MTRLALAALLLLALGGLLALGNKPAIAYLLTSADDGDDYDTQGL